MSQETGEMELNGEHIRPKNCGDSGTGLQRPSYVATALRLNVFQLPMIWSLFIFFLLVFHRTSLHYSSFKLQSDVLNSKYGQAPHDLTFIPFSYAKFEMNESSFQHSS